jgi:cysteinyl-tRNA synthetase
MGYRPIEKELIVTSTLSGVPTACTSQMDQCTPATPTTMYVCGVTPYDDAHIGHGRCYVTFDLVYRLLQASGKRVIYCRNVTDIDDKLLNRAEQELGSALRYQEIAQRYTARFREDVTALGCLPPTYEPLVTDNIPEIIACVEALIRTGHAYAIKGSVYFSIATYPTYGELSKQRIADMRAGSRVDINDEKRDPLDFALWKAEPEGQFWNSPWGWGRPGWHIECSAMALRYLGTTIDLHGGGMDLMFPHHENERAQSECCTGARFVRIWMHNAFVRVKQEKMSKSLGNFITLRQAFERVHPMVLRYYYLIHHYRSPLDFAYRRLVQLFSTHAPRAISDVLPPQTPPTTGPGSKQIRLSPESAEYQLYDQILTLLYNDLNVQGALGLIFEHIQTIRDNPQLNAALAQLCINLLGLPLQPLPEKTIEITPEIQKLLEERTAARARKDWARADAIRAELVARNVAVQDTKG